MSKRMSRVIFGSGVLVRIFALIGAVVAGTGQSLAQGKPENWQLGFQKGVTPIAYQIESFHNLLLIIITLIALFVLALLVIVVMRFNEKANPVPSKTTHNTTIEVLWTVIPIFILIVIAVPSFRLLYAQHSYPPADVTIKAIGNQWYWSYEYPDSDVSFDSVMLEDAELEAARKEGFEAPRLLAVDNPVVVPVNKVVHVLVTASDVIHNWTIPAFGSKIDGVPGRVTQTWFKAEKEGVYYGQCSELCGIRHAFMPIAVHVVSDSVYANWLKTVQEDEEKARKVLLQAELKRRGITNVANTEINPDKQQTQVNR